MRNKAGKSPNSLKLSLIALAGAGVSVAGCTQAEQATPDKPEDVVVSGGGIAAQAVAAPVNERVELPEEWQRVEIELTEDQRRDLAQLGVETDAIRITTYDISQLGQMVVN